MFHAASLRIGNREEYPQVVVLFKDAGGRSHRQHAGLLDVVYHLHRFAPPSVRYPLYPRRLHVASLALHQLAHSLLYNPGGSITNSAETIAAGVIRVNELPTPLVWTEHWPEESTQGQETFELVVFSSYEVTERAPYLGETREWIGDATWKGLDRATVEVLVGRKV
jgi:hypothetical protein